MAMTDNLDLAITIMILVAVLFVAVFATAGLAFYKQSQPVRDLVRLRGEIKAHDDD